MTPEQRFKCMSHNRAKNTGPDIVLPKYRTAIFVHGCFWHGHKDCKYYIVPKTNTDFWMSKVVRNQERDQEAWRKLEVKGWSVIIVWECELKKAKLDETIDWVTSEVVRNGVMYRDAREERKQAREDYRKQRREQKEREQAFLDEMKSLYPQVGKNRR